MNQYLIIVKEKSDSPYRKLNGMYGVWENLNPAIAYANTIASGYQDIQVQRWVNGAYHSTPWKGKA